jgi:hypothetical protein
MANTETFHIETAVSPLRLEKIIISNSINILSDKKTIYEEVKDSGIDINFNQAKRNLLWGRYLGIFEKPSKDIYSLSNLGTKLRQLANYRVDVYNELIHYLFQSRWISNGRKDNWSWTYRFICKSFWKNRPKIEKHSDIFKELMFTAKTKWDNENLVIAVGTEDVGLVKRFVGRLNPNAISSDGKVIERKWFSPELALLAVDSLYQELKLSYGSPIHMVPEVLDSLSPLCFSETDSIYHMIVIAADAFPFLNIQKGQMGTSVILDKQIKITSVF